MSTDLPLFKLVHITDCVGSQYLKSFMIGVFKQIQFFEPNMTYEDTNAFYAEINIAETLYQKPPMNVGQLYNELIQALPNRPHESMAIIITDDSERRTSTVPSQSRSSDTYMQSSATSSSERVQQSQQSQQSHQTQRSFDFRRAAPQSAQLTPQGNSAQNAPKISPALSSSGSIWRRSLDSVRRSYSSLFRGFRREKGRISLGWRTGYCNCGVLGSGTK